ncbi:hypothetical protein AMJ87_11125, partial [candidate division WOR_3 bacterium SM23_60]
ANTLKTIREVSEILSSDGTSENLVRRAHMVQNLLKAHTKRERELMDAVMRREAKEMKALLDEMKTKETPVLHREFQNFGMEALRNIADEIRNYRKNAVGFFYEPDVQGKVHYLVFVGQNLVKTHPANKLIKEIGKIVGGGGGGKPHLAEGGGGNPQKVAGGGGKPHLAEGGGGNPQKVAEAITYLEEKFKR